MRDYALPLDDDGIYHIFNRAVGHEKLFLNDVAYKHFLNKITDHLLPHIDIWSYCLMPNHFHLLAELKPESKGLIVSKAISNCCNGYTKWINGISGRKGSLFMRPFKRVKIENDEHLAQIIWYIHRNPIHHHYVNTLEEWKYSSYNSMFSHNSFVATQKVIQFFGGTEAFIEFHKLQFGDILDALE